MESEGHLDIPLNRAKASLSLSVSRLVIGREGRGMLEITR